MSNRRRRNRRNRNWRNMNWGRGGIGEMSNRRRRNWRWRNKAMQQPTSLREAQDKRTAAQQERGDAIEWQRMQ